MQRINFNQVAEPAEYVPQGIHGWQTWLADDEQSENKLSQNNDYDSVIEANVSIIAFMDTDVNEPERLFVRGGGQRLRGRQSY